MIRFDRRDRQAFPDGARTIRVFVVCAANNLQLETFSVIASSAPGRRRVSERRLLWGSRSGVGDCLEATWRPQENTHDVGCVVLDSAWHTNPAEAAAARAGTTTCIRIQRRPVPPGGKKPSVHVEPVFAGPSRAGGQRAPGFVLQMQGTSGCNFPGSVVSRGE